MLRVFTIAISLLALALLCAPITAQDDTVKPPPPKPVRDIVIDGSGNRFDGRITAIDEDGTVRFADGRIADLSQAARITFNVEDPLPAEALRRALVYRLVDGTAFNAQLVEWKGERVVLHTDFAGDIALDAKTLRGVECALDFHLPPEGRSDHDVIITANEEIVCDVLPLKLEKDSYDRSLVCKVEYVIDGKTQDMPIGRIKGVIYRNQDPCDPDKIPEGWYAHVYLVNGDRLCGVLDGFAEDKLRLVTRCAGVVEIERRYINEVVFSERLNFREHNLLLCDTKSRRIIELDHNMVEAWSYSLPGGHDPTFATTLPNGNIFVVCASRGTLLEISHTKTIVWQESSLGYCFCARTTANGNVVVSWRSPNGANGLTEYTPDHKKVREISLSLIVTYFAVLPNGEIIAFLPQIQGVGLIDINGKMKRQKGIGGRPHYLCALPDGGFGILHAAMGKIEIYDAAWNQTKIVPVTHPETYTFAVNPDGNVVYYEHNGNGYKIVEYTTKGELVSKKDIRNASLKIDFIGY